MSSIESLIIQYFREPEEQDTPLLSEVKKFVETFLWAEKSGFTLLLCGNGGCSALIDNLVCDLNLHVYATENKSKSNRQPGKYFKAINLASNPSVLTAIANDFGAEYVYSEQLKWYNPTSTILVCFSGSGTSKNIVSAITAANRLRIHTTLVTRNKNVLSTADHILVTRFNSTFPGQTGSNEGNFYFEDMVCKLSHLACGCLRHKVEESL